MVTNSRTATNGELWQVLFPPLRMNFLTKYLYTIMLYVLEGKYKMQTDTETYVPPSKKKDV